MFSYQLMKAISYGTPDHLPTLFTGSVIYHSAYYLSFSFHIYFSFIYCVFYLKFAQHTSAVIKTLLFNTNPLNKLSDHVFI